MIQAVEHVRPMRGGAQAHLIRADDGHHYVVKFLNNPQHPRVLANEWLATNLARKIGLSAPPCAVIDVPHGFVEEHQGLVVKLHGTSTKVRCGPAFASRIPVPEGRPVYDYLPEAGLDLVANLDEFAGALAFNKWLCNCDGCQVVFCKPKAGYRAFFIDFGFCFDAGDWAFPDSPLRGVYPRNVVYRGVTGWDSFEPWLSRIEAFSPRRLQAIAARMPRAWVSDEAALDRLIAEILDRRRIVRSLIRQVCSGPRAPFANWHDSLAVPA